MSRSYGLNVRELHHVRYSTVRVLDNCRDWYGNCIKFFKIFIFENYLFDIILGLVKVYILTGERCLCMYIFF